MFGIFAAVQPPWPTLACHITLLQASAVPVMLLTPPSTPASPATTRVGGSVDWEGG